MLVYTHLYLSHSGSSSCDGRHYNSHLWTTGGSEGVSYTVVWQRNTSGDCSDEDQGNDTITDGSTNYEIVNLEEDSSYSIEVTASEMKQVRQFVF